MIDMGNLELFRLANVLVGALASGLLVFRLITWWGRLDVLHHALGLGLGASLIIGTLYVSQIALIDADYVWSGWLLLAYRIGIVVLCVAWPRWIGRHTSPFRTDPRRTLEA